MKLPKNVFPSVSLSPEQCVAYERLADGVVNQALEEYDDFNGKRGRQLDRKRWKQIKKSDAITVFCERSRRSSSTSGSSSASSHSSSASASASAGNASAEMPVLDYSESEDDLRDTMAMINSPVSKLSTAAVSSIAENEVVVSTSKKDRAALPKLLAVGRVPGKVEDMLYGMSSPTPTHSKIKTAYVDDEVADAKVLCEIRGATPDDPLRYVGLKWMIKGHSKVIGAVVRQRDLVFVESIGLKTRADGSRFGYFVMHSVEVPECGELAQFSIVRARISLVYILRQDGPGQVDVFMKSYVELNGTLPDSVGVRTSANSLISIAVVEIGGHNRKMGWEVTKRMRNPHQSSPLRPPCSSYSNCSNCSKSFSVFTTALVCYFCTSRVCSRCCEQRVLTIPNPAAKSKSSSSAPLVLHTPTNACKHCYSAVFRAQNAEHVAREEVLAGEYGSIPKTTTTAMAAGASRATRSQTASSNGSFRVPSTASVVSTPQAKASSIVRSRGPRAVSVDASSTSSMSTEDLSNLVHHLALQSSGSTIEEKKTECRAADREWSDSVVELDSGDFEWGQRPQYAVHPPPAPTHQTQSTAVYATHPVPPSGGENLYERITRLQQTAEHVYHYTKRATDTVLAPSGAPMGR